MPGSVSSMTIDCGESYPEICRVARRLSAWPSGRLRSGQNGPPAAAGASHRILVRVLLSLATVLAIVAIFAVWANRQLMNPSHWSRTSTALLQKQTIRTALATYLVDQLYANVDVRAQLKSGLPPRLEPLAGPIAGALHNVAEKGTGRTREHARIQN